MSLSFLPTPASEHSKQSPEVRFTIRSANSPSYRLSRRPGVRKPKSLVDQETETTEEVGERHGTHIGTNFTNKVEDSTFYLAKTGVCSSVKGQCEETLGHKMFNQLNQNDLANETITDCGTDRSENCNLVSERRGRTDWRRHNLPSRSKSLDWRTGERSPDRDQRTYTFMYSTTQGGDVGIRAEGVDERMTGGEGIKGRVMSPLQTYVSAGNDGQDRNPVSHVSPTFNRVDRVNSFPSRLKLQSGPISDSGTATMMEPQGSQSISERIEQLYWSAGFGKTDDYNNIRDFSKPALSHHKEKTTDLLISPQQRSYERTTGGTFPRRFSSEGKLGISPKPSRTSLTWAQNDTSGSEGSFSPGTCERLSRGEWIGQTLDRFSVERRDRWSRAYEDIGTKSLDREAHKRALTAAGGITTPPKPNTLEVRSLSCRDLSKLSERRGIGSKEEGKVNHGEENVECNGIDGTPKKRSGGVKQQEREKDTDEVANIKTGDSIDQDVFELNPQKIPMKTTEKSKISEILSIPTAASVKNKINQFEALTQRFQVLASGQALPRRAFSVPTQLTRARNEGRKGGSVKAVGGLRAMWEGLKDGEEAAEKTEEKEISSGEKVGSARSLSVDEVGLRLVRNEQEGKSLVENEGKEKDRWSTSVDDLNKYSKLKNRHEIPLAEGNQRQHRNFYIDETDFTKVSSPKEANKKPSYLPLSNSSDISAGVQTTTQSPVVDEDKTPTNTPTHSAFLSSSTPPEKNTPITVRENESTPILMQAAITPKRDSSPHHGSPSNTPNLISPDVSTAHRNRCIQSDLDLNAWLAGLNTKIKVWDNEEDSEDDDESTQKDEDSNYNSDSGESSVTITSNLSQSDHRSFSVSLSDLCDFAGVDYESENDSDEWQPTGQRSASLSSDMSTLSCVSVLPTEELNRLLEDVRSLGDSNLQDYNDVQVVVLHKEPGVGLGFSVAGGLDQNKPVTVHKVFHSGVAAQQGSIKEGDQILSINGTSLCECVHWEALKVLRIARTRNLGVVVLRRGGISTASKEGEQTNNPGPTQTQLTETGQRVHVCLEKNSRDLGFSLQGGAGFSLEDRPLTVQKIFQGGPVDQVNPGDEVLEIEGVSMTGMRRLEAWTLIRRLPPGPVEVVLRRPLKHLET